MSLLSYIAGGQTAGQGVARTKLPGFDQNQQVDDVCILSSEEFIYALLLLAEGPSLKHPSWPGHCPSPIPSQGRSELPGCKFENISFQRSSSGLLSFCCLFRTGITGKAYGSCQFAWVFLPCLFFFRDTKLDLKWAKSSSFLQCGKISKAGLHFWQT